MRKFIYYSGNGKVLEFTNKSGFQITNIENLSGNNIEITEASAELQIGASITYQRVEPKTITIEGDFRERYENRRVLIDAIAPMTYGKLRLIDTENDVDVYIEGVPKQTPILSNDKVYQKFMFDFYCPYPYWKSTVKKNFDYFSRESQFRFPRSFSNTVPWKISTRTVINILDIVNDGTVETGFEVRAKALDRVVAPEIVNVLTQQRIKMKDNFTLDIDDTLVLYNYNDDLRVLKQSKGVETNVFGYVDIDQTDFFKLKVGSNVIQMGAKQNADKLDVTLQFDKTLAGV